MLHVQQNLFVCPEVSINVCARGYIVESSNLYRYLQIPVLLEQSLAMKIFSGEAVLVAMKLNILCHFRFW